MKLLQILQKCLEDWKNISHLDFCLVHLDNTIYISTCDRALPSEEKLEEFKEDEALCISNMNCRLYKVTESHQLQYILIVWGNAEAASTIGELAVCQIESLLTAYMEKSDKNVFMQNLLLGSYSEVDAFNRAKKLHIATTVRRAVFLVETKQSKDENALATIRNIFAAKTRDFITAIDDSGIIILRELQPSEDYSDLDDIAHMLVDMLNTEAMTSAWVSYSNIADDLKQLPDAYKEARTALEVGKIFYTGKNVFGYNRLGIGRLIYQLPVEICEMFIDEFCFIKLYFTGDEKANGKVSLGNMKKISWKLVAVKTGNILEESSSEIKAGISQNEAANVRNFASEFALHIQKVIKQKS